MKPITSMAVAKSLPERGWARFSEVKQSDGTTVITPYFTDIVAVDRDDKEIILFLDKDGRVMMIGYDSEGAYKYPSSL